MDQPPPNNSHCTAIYRKTLPLPTRWLLKNGYLSMYSVTLDFGCGNCMSVNPTKWDNYDPYYRPWTCWHKKCYKTIICNYVLNTLPKAEHVPVLKEIQKKLDKTGNAYISVRNDKPKTGWGISKRRTYRSQVSLDLPIIHSNSSFQIYHLTKKNKLIP